MSLSTDHRTKVLEYVFKRRSWPSASGTALYYSLHSAEPDGTGSNELSGGGYARAQLNPDINNATNTNYNAVTAGGIGLLISNILDIVWPTATADWNGGLPITWLGVWRAATAGEFIAKGQFDTPAPTVLNGNTLKLLGSAALGVPPGDLRFEVD